MTVTGTVLGHRPLADMLLLTGCFDLLNRDRLHSGSLKDASSSTDVFPHKGNEPFFEGLIRDRARDRQVQFPRSASNNQGQTGSRTHNRTIVAWL